VQRVAPAGRKTSKLTSE